ncbi:MAG: recombinase family protein, partial [Oscillospiraceae bacterium]
EHKFDIVLCKTQSRFTRDMEIVEKYIHGHFIRWGIRFVAIVDNVDTEVKGSKKTRQINGLINEWYLEDLSDNIKAVFDNKRKHGYYIGGFPVYGYKKHPTEKGKLAIDEEAAAVVRKIFSLYLEGNGKQHITTLLNEQKIPNPTLHKQLCGIPYQNGLAKKSDGRWNRTSIARILREQMYTGDMVQGRTKKLSYKEKQTVPTEKDEWIIVPDTQEAIISREDFERVQNVISHRTRASKTGERHPLAGRLRCADCGSNMRKMTVYPKSLGSGRSYVKCRGYESGAQICKSNHSMRLDVLESLIADKIKGYIVSCCDMEAALEAVSDCKSEQAREAVFGEMEKAKREIEKRKKAMRNLYLDKSEGVIDAEQFKEISSAYLAETSSIEERCAVLQRQLEQCARDVEKDMELSEKVERWLGVKELTGEIVSYFVDYIEIGQRDRQTNVQQIIIHWAF